MPDQQRTDVQGRTFKVGQKVTWTVTGSNTRVVSMRRKDGFIAAFPPNGSEFAIVRRMYGKRKGPKSALPLSALTAEGEPTALTKFVEAIRSATYQP